MDDLVKQKLSKLFSLLLNPGVKSKQAAFNACYEELTQVKELSSWETIVNIIKQETEIDIEWRTASNMYGRARKKLLPAGKKTAVNVNETLATNSDREMESRKKASSPADLKKIRDRKIDLDDLTNGD
ncbi:hypothetical protein [Erwinia amylovora]|nr:hypothetical protein [Erwinia amylovora]UDJ88586.1 hypothetical protein IRM68_17955 [Erwinia amylovora]